MTESATPKRAVLVSIALALLCAGVVLHNGSLAALSVPFVAYVVLALLVTTKPELAVSVRRETSAGKIFEGGKIELVTALTNGGGELGLLRVEDTLPRGLKLASGNNVGFAILSRGEGLEMRYGLTSDAPGTYAVGPIVLSATDAFGLTSKISVLDDAFQLDVMPRVEQRRSIPFRPRKTENWSGQVVSPRAGSGQDFYAVRQYVPTDPARMVNWKAWARLDKMYSNQFMSELGADAVIVVDKSHASDFGVPPESALTYVERCAAAVASGLIFAGNRVGMVMVGDRVYRINPGTGRRQIERILLAIVRAKGGEAEGMGLLPEYLSLWFPRASSVIAVSSLANQRIVSPLVRIGARRNLQVISPAFFGAAVEDEEKAVSELARMLVRLQRKTTAGLLRRYADVVEWDVGIPIETILDRALLGRNRVVAR
jgi:uncharacterized protein (DUF58 family)